MHPGTFSAFSGSLIPSITEGAHRAGDEHVERLGRWNTVDSLRQGGLTAARSALVLTSASVHLHLHLYFSKKLKLFSVEFIPVISIYNK